jgi:beta-lactamase superfamily II metal-dependent hydrolase
MKEKPKKIGPGYDVRDWDEYQRIRQKKSNPAALFLYRGSEGQFYTDDNISILSPSLSLKEECNKAGDWNNLCYVLKIAHGSSSLLLPGDAEEKAQKQVLDYYGNKLAATILKAPHHGRYNGYFSDFVKAVNPDYTIVSVGKKPENDATNKYRQFTKKKVYSTRFMGTIYAELFCNGAVRIWNSHKKGKERIDEEPLTAVSRAQKLLDNL